jgi:hypothetical protein
MAWDDIAKGAGNPDQRPTPLGGVPSGGIKQGSGWCPVNPLDHFTASQFHLLLLANFILSSALSIKAKTS